MSTKFFKFFTFTVIAFAFFFAGWFFGTRQIATQFDKSSHFIGPDQTHSSTGTTGKTTETGALLRFTTPDVALTTTNETSWTASTTNVATSTTSTGTWCGTEQTHTTNWNTPTTLTWATRTERA
jgi:hypothetical protein